MTKEQASGEMEYRLCKYILQALLDAEMITTSEAVTAKSTLCEKYNPFTRCLEELDVWQTEL